MKTISYYEEFKYDFYHIVTDLGSGEFHEEPGVYTLQGRTHEDNEIIQVEVGLTLAESFSEEKDVLDIPVKKLSYVKDIERGVKLSYL